MKANKIFISAPLAMNWSTVLQYCRRLDGKNIKPVAWDRESKYDQDAFDECGSVIFILPKAQFSATVDELPTGMKRELARAYEQSKQIYIGYRSMDGEHRIYEAETDGKLYISGTGKVDSIFQKIQNRLEYDKAAKVASNGMYGAFVMSTGIEYGELDHPGNSKKLSDSLQLLPKAMKIYGSAIPVFERYSKGAIGELGPIGTPGVMGEDGYDERLLLGL